MRAQMRREIVRKHAEEMRHGADPNSTYNRRMRRALILGATGLVGSELLAQISADKTITQIVTITRRPIADSRFESHVLPLEEMHTYPALFETDEIFCALGTTIKTAGSQEEFRRIDHDLPLAAAKLGRQHGAGQFLLVSSLGADSKSRIFYNRVKGELEDDLLALDYPSVTMARPSLLLGARPEPRSGEEMGKKFGWLTPARYKPIEASAVARALVDAAREGRPGVRILESTEMRGGK